MRLPRLAKRVGGWVWPAGALGMGGRRRAQGGMGMRGRRAWWDPGRARADGTGTSARGTAPQARRPRKIRKRTETEASQEGNREPRRRQTKRSRSCARGDDFEERNKAGAAPYGAQQNMLSVTGIGCSAPKRAKLENYGAAKRRNKQREQKTQIARGLRPATRRARHQRPALQSRLRPPPPALGNEAAGQLAPRLPPRNRRLQAASRPNHGAHFSFSRAVFLRFTRRFLSLSAAFSSTPRAGFFPDPARSSQHEPEFHLTSTLRVPYFIVLFSSSSRVPNVYVNVFITALLQPFNAFITRPLTPPFS